MRSESGKTVDEPAVRMSPLTASGAYLATASSGAAAAVGAGATTVDAGAADVPAVPEQAVRERLRVASIHKTERIDFIISFFLLQSCLSVSSYQPAFKGTGRIG